MSLTSIFGQLLMALQDKIQADVPEILHIDQDFGQLEIPAQEGRYPVKFPCLLIDFVDTNYEERQVRQFDFEEARNAQFTIITVQLRLAFDKWEATSEEQTVTVRERALQYYEIEQKIYRILNDWNANDLLMLPFTRKRSQSEKRELDGLRVRVISYEATYEDRDNPDA